MQRASDTDEHRGSMWRVMSLRDFRLLFAATATSLLGDQFALVATPWLVLQLTGDPLVLGIVLALEGLSRAAFMLIGGAVTDRFSPRPVMPSSRRPAISRPKWRPTVFATACGHIAARPAIRPVRGMIWPPMAAWMAILNI